MTEEIYLNSVDQLYKYKDAERAYITHWIEDLVDLSLFRNLKELKLAAVKRKGLESLTSLESLGISKINRNEDLSKLINLNELSINGGNIQSLDFLKNYNNLKKLELFYLYKLKDVTGLLYVKDSLEYLEIASCKNIEWNGELVQLNNLRKLILGGFKFDDIKWIKDLSHLEHLSLVDSNVLDGDISPAQNVAYVGIDNRRHYNYKFDDSTMKIVPK